MNNSGIIIIINYMLCLYGAFCFFNGLQLMKQGNNVQSSFPSIHRLENPVLRMNPDHVNFIRENIAYGRYGKEWSYQDLVSNVQHNSVDFASILNNANILVAIDNKHSGDVSLDNLHYVKMLPNLVQHIVDILIQNKVQFVIENFNGASNLTLVDIFVKSVGVFFAYGAFI